MMASNTHPVPIPKSVVNDYILTSGLAEDVASHKCGELAKFLRACAISKEPLSPSVAIDDVWHEFILHTDEYITYCNKEFGKIIHHFPLRTAAPEELRESYLRTINLLTHNYGEIDTNLWPVNDGASIAICDSGGCKGH